MKISIFSFFSGENESMSLVLGHVGQNVGKIGLHIQFCSFFVTLLSNYLPAAGWQIPKITLKAGANTFPHFCTEVVY